MRYLSRSQIVFQESKANITRHWNSSWALTVLTWGSPSHLGCPLLFHPTSNNIFYNIMKLYVALVELKSVFKGFV